MNPEREPWMVDAVCATTDAELFFPAVGDWHTANRARKFCNECPVNQQCLNYALRTQPTDGIWAGLTVKQIRTQRKVQQARVRRARKRQETAA